MPQSVIAPRARCALSGVSLLLLCGCFVETSHPFRTGDAVVPDELLTGPRRSARLWLAEAHPRLEGLLPSGPTAMLTGDMVDAGGRPVDVFAHFPGSFEHMDELLSNFDGLLDTTHLAARDTHVDVRPADWPGFVDVWIPVANGLELAGRMAWCTGGGEQRRADCIVILPGLFGDNGVWRTRDLAIALHRNGQHVLALELRACGQTQARHPAINEGWGVFETADLLAVSEWLEAKPQVACTGLIGFCWGANIALLTAWADGRAPDHPSITPQLAPFIQRSNGPHYTAGIMAFSPTLRFEDLIEHLEHECSPLREPALYGFQQTVRDRTVAQGYRPITGSLRRLIVSELDGYHLPFADPIVHALRYLRFLPHRGEPDGDKLEDARVPVLLVQAANDPLNSAQDLADLVAKTANPNVAALILPGGGHVGFAAYARAYYFSLILNFFDANRGPVPAPIPAYAG